MYIPNKIFENILFQVLQNRIKNHQHLVLLRYSNNATLNFALSHNALSQQNQVIVSKRFRSWYIGAVIAS
jgi:hypothetical protein